MRTSGQLRREEAFDVWLDERFGSSTASGSDRAHETPADWDADLEAMAKVAEFVCLLAPVDPTTAVPYAPPPHRLPSPLRIAAVVMLLLGRASGLWLVASRSGHAPEVPAGTVTPGLMPSGLYAELETQAGTSGNPYPSTPVLWVKTTAGATENLLRDYHVGSQPGVSAGTVEWVGQVTSRFYGDPEHESNVYGTILEVWIRPVHPPTPIPAGPSASGFPAAPLSVLEQLGAVHSQFLRPPPPAPVLPALLSRTLEGEWSEVYRGRQPSVPVLWVKTTVGTIGSGTDRAIGLPSTPAAMAVWVVHYRATFGSSPPGHAAASDWYVTTNGRTPLWQVTGRLSLPPSARRIGDLTALGRVQELWLDGGAPSVLSPQEWQNLKVVLPSEYRGEMTTLHVAWVGTTAGRLRSEVPWTAISQTVPGPTPVWIVEASDVKAPGGFSDQWFMDWDRNPSTQSGGGTWLSSGGSGLFGITHLSQLGSVHDVNVSALLNS
jgi:hypothetical protein